MFSPIRRLRASAHSVPQLQAPDNPSLGSSLRSYLLQPSIRGVRVPPSELPCDPSLLSEADSQVPGSEGDMATTATSRASATQARINPIWYQWVSATVLAAVIAGNVLRWAFLGETPGPGSRHYLHWVPDWSDRHHCSALLNSGEWMDPGKHSIWQPEGTSSISHAPARWLRLTYRRMLSGAALGRQLLPVLKLAIAQHAPCGGVRQVSERWPCLSRRAVHRRLFGPNAVLLLREAGRR